MTPELTIVVMAYDEAATLERTALELLEVGRRLSSAVELLIVDDGSRDATGAIADTLAEAHPEVRVVHHRPNRGLGGVYRTGFDEARGSWLSFFPADGQFPAVILEDFWPRRHDRDLVLGYLTTRRHGIGRFLSAAERLLYRVLFGPLPRFQGVFLLRRDVLRTVVLTSTGRGWAIVMELLVRAARADLRIESRPTAFRPRTEGGSKVVNWRTVRANLDQALALRRDLRRRG